MNPRPYHYIPLLLLLALPLRAQTMDECIDMALRNNLSLRAGAAAVEATSRLQGTALEIEPTELSLSQDPTGGGGPENALTLSQRLDFPTKYLARWQERKSETALAKSLQGVSEAEVRRSVMRGYSTLVYSLHHRRILRLQQQLYRRFLTIARARHRGGEVGALELLNAEKVSEEMTIALSRADLAVSSAELSLRHIVNSPDTIIPTDTLLTPLALRADLLEETPFEGTAEGRREQARQRVSEARVRVARAAFLPDITLGVRRQALIPSFNPYGVAREPFPGGSFMGFEIGVSIPLFWSGLSARYRSSQAELRQVTLEGQSIARRQALERSEALRTYYWARQSLDFYESRGGDIAQQIISVAEKRYEASEIDYPEYIQNLQSALDIQLGRLRAIQEYNYAIIDLMYLQGKQ